MLLDVLMREWTGRRWPWVAALLAALAAAAAALAFYAGQGGGWLLVVAALPVAVALAYFLAVRLRQPAEED
jgi:peptidoglycan/LPS O-acetylase OafA/YrhL